ncbi:MAG TPA: ribonuclease III [Candidatus Akkermansia intestinavium]|nr:ribonuclease III [Candidatus Akkermansia intestinavium]
MDRETVENTLGYRFSDETWLRQALTHPSADQKRSTNIAYERLEYLGDAVLELVVSCELFRLHPKADEGELTKWRAAVVSRRHLAERCRALGWGEQLLMSAQLEKSGGRETLSILANTFESVIGAVMMDSNYNAARKVSLRLLGESIAKARTLSAVNSKGELLETLQAIGPEGPVYETAAVRADAPAGPFRATVSWRGRLLGEALGSSKHAAEMEAAAEALRRRLWVKERAKK